MNNYIISAVNNRTGWILVAFYIISYFTPEIFILYRKSITKEDEETESRINFHKSNALLFLFIIVLVLGALIVFYVILFLVVFAITDGTLTEKIYIAGTKYISFLWNNGKTSNMWISLIMSIVLAYSIISVYFAVLPPNLKDNLFFPMKVQTNREDDEETEEQDTEETEGDAKWKSRKVFYKLLIAYMMAIVVFVLALFSLYAESNACYICVVIYIFAILSLFIATEYVQTIPLSIILLLAPSFLVK